MNPYQPPQADLIVLDGRGGGTWDGEPGDFDIDQCFRDGWRATWDDWVVGALWPVAALALLIVAYLSVFVLVGFFLLPILGWGVTRLVLNLQDGRASYGDFFTGFPIFFTAWWRFVVILAALAGLGLVGGSINILGALTGETTVALLGQLVSLVFAGAVTVRFYFAPYFAVDRDMTAGEALRASWHVTRHHPWKVIGLNIAIALVTLAGFCVFLVGAIPASSMAYVAFASAYRPLTGTRQLEA